MLLFTAFALTVLIAVSSPSQVPAPDLVISSGMPQVTPSTVPAGGTVQLSAWTVTNTGTAPSGFFSNGFYLSTDSVITAGDTYLDGNSNTSLAPGASFNWGGPTLTIPAATKSGNYYIGILVDSINAVAESSEGNNYVSTLVTVTVDQPDLVISSGMPQVTPSTVPAGGTVQLSAWTVTNTGTVPSGFFSNGFYLSTDSVITAGDTYLDGNSNTSLAPGASFNWGGPTLTIPAATKSGNYYIGILVDSTNAVAESSEGNNYVSTLVTVTVDQPDLLISSGMPQVTPSTVPAGGTVQLSAWTVTNTGTAPSGFFSNGFYLSTDGVTTAGDTYLDGNSNTSLAPGASFNWGGPTLTIPAATKSGNYYIGILVDSTNAVAESSEGNNYVSTLVTVTVDQPDLLISSGMPQVTPSTVPAGGTVQLSAWTVTNTGTAPSGFFSNGFYLSTDSVITAGDTYLDGNSNTSLAPGASFNWGGPTLTIPAATKSGNYYIGILVDSTNAVAESSEGNNYVSTLVTVSLTVSPPLTITTTSLPSGTAGGAYSAPVEAAGGTTPYRWSIISGSLPPGLSLDPSTGVISGTPSAAGAFTFAAAVTDASDTTDSRDFSILITSPLTITTTSLPSGTAGGGYSAPVEAAGGTTPYRWSIISGSLPPGLSLDPSTGLIGGTPSAAGTFSFAAAVTDATDTTASEILTLSINAAVTINTTSPLASGIVNEFYRVTLSRSGGSAPFVWSIFEGSLPTGLTLGQNTGTISGIPLVEETANFSVGITDAEFRTFEKEFSLTISPTFQLILRADLANGIVGELFSTTLPASGGQPPYSWSILTGVLPPGLTLDPSTGVIAGIPTMAGTFPGTALVTDSQGLSAAVQFTIRIETNPNLTPQLGVSPNQLTFSVTQQSQLAIQRLLVLNQGGGRLSFSALASTDSGGAWLTVSPPNSEATAAVAAALVVTVNSAGLGPGTFSGRIEISSPTTGETVLVPVALAISRREQQLRLSQVGLTFGVISGGAGVPPQDFHVLTRGLGELHWAISTTTLSGGPSWLLLSPDSGSSSPSQGPPVEVRVDPTGLESGVYHGQVEISSPGAANSPQFLAVVLNLLAVGSRVGPLVRPSGLIFVGSAGRQPGSQPIQLFNLASDPISFTSSVVTVDGDNWLAHSPVAGTLAADQPTSLVLQPDLTGLAPGVYRALVTLMFSDGTNRTVTVVLIVTPASIASLKALLVAQSVCSRSELVPVLTLLSGGSATSTGGFPGAIQVEVRDNCGRPMEQGLVIVEFSNINVPPLGLEHTQASMWSGTLVTPVGVGPLTGSITITATDPQLGISGSETVNLGIDPNPNPPPQVSQGAILHGASFVVDPHAPGSMISIFGERLSASAGGEQAADLPLPLELAETQIRLGGVRLPLLFSREDQVNAVVPFDLADRVNESLPLVIVRARSISIPLQAQIVAARPGVFALSGSGSGPGVIQDVNGQIVTVDNPVSPGDAIVIYCTGLGEVNPEVQAGMPAPRSPLSETTRPVSVTIGGLEAPIIFAGLTPDFTGLYQINAVVPQAVPPGDAVVAVSIDGQASRDDVTISVH